MSLAENRAEKLAAYLTADTERAQKLLDLTVEEATSAINADGYDFEVEEVKAFGDELQTYWAAASENGELSEADLDSVSGGVVITAAVLAAGVALFTAGVTFGYQVARDRGW